MPRPSQGPRLRPHKRNGKTMWIIRDGQRNVGTGCVVGKGPEGDASFAEAQKSSPNTSEKNTTPKQTGEVISLKQQ